MSSFYCEYCGARASSVSGLTGSSCTRHPNGNGKGKHKLYEGAEKSQYVCKYCGSKTTSLSGLTSSSCTRHPFGNGKGKHAPAL